MAPAELAAAVTQTGYQGVLQKNRSIVDELCLQDALLREKKAARKKITLAEYMKRQGKNSAGPSNASNTAEQVPMPVLTPAVPVAKGFAKLPPEVSHEVNVRLAVYSPLTTLDQSRDREVPARQGSCFFRPDSA